MVYNAEPDLTEGDAPRHGKSTSNSGSLNPANPDRLFRPSAHRRCRTHGRSTTTGGNADSLNRPRHQPRSQRRRQPPHHPHRRLKHQPLRHPKTNHRPAGSLPWCWTTRKRSHPNSRTRNWRAWQGVADVARLLTIFNDPRHGHRPRSRSKLINCLQDETLTRMFLTGLIQDIGALSIETSACVRIGFSEIDLRSVMLAGLQGDPQTAMAGSMAALLFLTMACLNQEEWDAAAPAMDMAPGRPGRDAVPPGGDGRTRGDGCGSGSRG